MKENLLTDKSISFASRIIKLHQYLIKTQKETIISKQIVRSGTSQRTCNLFLNISNRSYTFFLCKTKNKAYVFAYKNICRF